MMPEYFALAGCAPWRSENIFDIIDKTLRSGATHKESHWMSKLNDDGTWMSKLSDDGTHATWFKQGYEHINTTCNR